jgi:hypothetical protein
MVKRGIVVNALAGKKQAATFSNAEGHQFAITGASIG